MQQNASYLDTFRSASHNDLHCVCKTNAHVRVHNLTLDLTVNQINLIHYIETHFFKVN